MNLCAVIDVGVAVDGAGMDGARLKCSNLQSFSNTQRCTRHFSMSAAHEKPTATTTTTSEVDNEIEANKLRCNFWHKLQRFIAKRIQSVTSNLTTRTSSPCNLNKQKIYIKFKIKI